MMRSSVSGPASEQMIIMLSVEAIQLRGIALATTPLSMFFPNNSATVPYNTKYPMEEVPTANYNVR